MNDKTTDIIFKDIIEYHDKILNKLKILIDNECSTADETMSKVNKKHFYSEQTINTHEKNILIKYKILKQTIRPDIESITKCLLYIISNAITKDEYEKLYQILSKARSYNHEKSSIDILLNRYNRYGKRYFMQDIIKYYYKYISYLSYPRLTIARPIYYDIYDRTYINFVSIKSNFYEKSIFIIDWFKLREGRKEGGSNSPSMAKIMASAIRDAILHTRDPSRKSVWGYFDKHTIDNTLILDTGIHEIYQETIDNNNENMCLDEQRLVIVNLENGEKWEVKYKSLYHVIKNVKKDLSM